MAGAGLIVPLWPDAPANIGALATSRRGGVSVGPYDDAAGAGGLNLGLHVGDVRADVERNRALLQAQLPGRPAWLSQVHGVAVLDAALVDADMAAPEADASFSGAPGVVCAVLTADCLPVLLADAHGKVVAAAHAGWRGLAAGILGQTVAAMRGAGAGDIVAWLGPAIGAQQFEVGADVRASFLAGARSPVEQAQVLAAFVAYPGRADKYLADIYALARGMLARDGVVSVAGGERCTVSERSEFYSYRRDGVSGRQATLIWRT